MPEPLHSDLNPRGGDVNLRSGPQMREYDAIAKRIAADAPDRVLDWGAGFGQMSALLHDLGLTVTAFDHNPDCGGSDVVQHLERYPHLSVH